MQRKGLGSRGFALQLPHDIGKLLLPGFCVLIKKEGQETHASQAVAGLEWLLPFPMPSAAAPGR